MERTDVASHAIDLSVKNKNSLFSSNRVNMGQLHLDLSQFGDLASAATDWYDACVAVEFTHSHLRKFFTYFCVISDLCFPSLVFLPSP